MLVCKKKRREILDSELVRVLQELIKAGRREGGLKVRK